MGRIQSRGGPLARWSGTPIPTFRRAALGRATRDSRHGRPFGPPPCPPLPVRSLPTPSRSSPGMTRDVPTPSDEHPVPASPRPGQSRGPILRSCFPRPLAVPDTHRHRPGLLADVIGLPPGAKARQEIQVARSTRGLPCAGGQFRLSQATIAINQPRNRASGTQLRMRSDRPRSPIAGRAADYRKPGATDPMISHDNPGDNDATPGSCRKSFRT